MTNHKLTITAAIAVIASALSLYSLLMGNGWMAAAIGATATVAVAGTLTRLATIPAAIAATAAVLLAFVPALAAEGWPGTLGALALVAITAASATGARLPRAFAAPATYLGFLLLYLNLVFGHARSFAGFIPTARSLTFLAGLPSHASTEFRFSPPVPTTRPVEFVAAAGIGAIAILVDLLAVRLRRPAIAGLPLLLLFSVPVASSLKGFGLYQTLTFGAGIAAYLALLSADGKQRLRMWGRLVTIRRVSAAEGTGAGPDTRELAASGRRVGLAAVAVAMVVPVVLVGSKPHDLFKRTDNGTGVLGLSGPGGTVSPLLTALRRQLSLKTPQPILTYRTDAPDPTQVYLQEYVLNYDPRTDHWLPVPSPARPVRPPQLPYSAPGLDSNATLVRPVHTTVDVGQFQAGPLPLPYAPVQISRFSTSLTEESGSLMVFDQHSQSNLTFSVTSQVPDPSEKELSLQSALPTGIIHAFGGYTGPDFSKLLKIAQAHTAHADTALQQAVALQKWFDSGAFTYTTNASVPDTRGWLLQFLTAGKRGDCQQFAPAFAVLARLLGIPSRVVVGYTGGQALPDGSWQVTTADAHAWPELYFPFAGWIRFEPTPNAPGDQGTASLPSYTQGVLPPLQTSLPSTGATAPTGGPSGKPGKGLSKKLADQPGGIGASGLKGSGSRFPVGIVVGVLVFLLLAWPAAGRWLTSRRRWITASGDAELAQAAWRELVDFLTDYGLSGLPSESPRATAARLADSAELAPAAREAVTRIGAAEERALYSLRPVPGTGLRADVARVRKAIAVSCTWPERLRALLVPASTVAVVRGGLQSANRALTWLDSPLPSMRRQSGRRTPHQAG
jgi:transglutaminase-like putative cysteine protease